jgi:hypothetical protein
MEERVQWFDPSLGTPIVSVSKTGLTFNRAAVVLLNRPAFVEVGVDSRDKCLVVRGVNAGGDAGTGPQPGEDDRARRALPFWRSDSPTPFVRVSNKDLIRFIKGAVPEVEIEKATKYLTRLDPERRHLVVDLRQPLGGRRRRKRG